jgi:high-affinity Fe2+/Pb2+ permease
MLASFLITFREALEAALIILEGMAALTAAIVHDLQDGKSQL